MGDSDVVEIKQVVELLRHPPFNRNESLVGFSSKTGTELLQIVNDVFTELDARHKKDIKNEPQDQLTARMIDFLTTLNYKIPGDPLAFAENFVRGQPSVIYPLLYWMLSRLDSLKKRAYLGRFLRPIEVPEEYFADDAIVGIYGMYKEKQAEFKEVHKQYDALLQSALKPNELEKEVNQLELEKEQLTNKLAKLNHKITTDPEFTNIDFKHMLTITNLLRQEQEEEARLYQHSMEQKQKLIRTEQIKQSLGKKLSELQSSDISKLEPAKLLNKLRFEIADKRSICDDKLETAIREQEKQLKNLEKIMSGDSMNEEQVMELEHEVAQIRSVVSQLSQKRDAQNAANGDKIGFFRERASAAEKKKEKLIEQLNELNQEKKEVEEELEKLTNELNTTINSQSNSSDGSANSNRPRTDAQMKVYMQQLTAKTTQYKELKSILESRKNENMTLARTEEILRSRDSNLAELNADLEKQKGIVGFSDTSAQLENVAMAKNTLDENKGATLDEMSRVVEQMGQKLAEKKNTMAPQIKELRNVRQACDDMEAIYNEKKKTNDNRVLGYESDRVKLEQDVAQNAHGVQEEESSYHFLVHLLTIEQARKERLQQEEKFLKGEGRLSAEFASYKDCYEKAILDQENLAKSLRNQKKDVTENHDKHVQQRAMFQNLRSILQKKHQLVQQAKANQKIMEEQMMMAGMEMGADRLVMD